MNRNGPFQDRVGSIWDRFRVNIAFVATATDEIKVHFPDFSFKFSVYFFY